MHIGLIGGIGPAAQDYYTRKLIALFAGTESQLDMTTVYADAKTVLMNLADDRRREQAEIFGELADRLQRAGAAFVAVTSIAGHFCREEFTARSPLPVIDMLDAVAQDVARRGLKRIGILGTRTVMETRLYGGITTATLIPPSAIELDRVHTAYAAMATAGEVTADQRDIFETAAHTMIDEAGAPAILLGGTDLALVFDAETSSFPLVNCAEIHAKAIASYAILNR